MRLLCICEISNIHIFQQLIYFKYPIKPVLKHYNDVIMSMMASQITSLTIVYSDVCSRPDQRKHQSSVSLAFVGGIHHWLVNSLHKGPVTWKMFPFDDVIMIYVTVQGRNFSQVLWSSRIFLYLMYIASEWLPTLAVKKIIIITFSLDNQQPFRWNFNTSWNCP